MPSSCTIGRLLHRLCRFGWFFRLFNWGFERSTNLYTRAVGLLLRGSIVALALYGGLLALTWWSFTRVPVGFIPEQDKGYLLANVQLPEGASVERTTAVIARLDKLARSLPGVGHTLGVSGMSILLQANAPNFGSMFVILNPFDQRHEPQLRDKAIAAKLRQICYKEFPGAVVSVFGAPPVDGLGTAGGFKIMVEDRGDAGLAMLQQATDTLIDRANRQPGLVGLFTLFRSNTPQIYADIDRDQGQVDGRERGRRLQYPASLHGLALREQLQRVRPLLASQAPGRRAVPPHGRAGRAAEGPKPGRRNGAA